MAAELTQWLCPNSRFLCSTLRLANCVHPNSSLSWNPKRFTSIPPSIASSGAVNSGIDTGAPGPSSRPPSFSSSCAICRRMASSSSWWLLPAELPGVAWARLECVVSDVLLVSTDAALDGAILIGLFCRPGE